jgi:hypothetical protein
VSFGSPVIAARSSFNRFWLCIAAWTALSAPALASANVGCEIDDKFINFSMEAIAGRSGPITQVNVGKISIKPAARLELAGPDISFDRSHIVQQWIAGDDLRLQIEVGGNLQTINLIIVARLDAAKDKYFGNYVLTLARAGATKELKGRIKECEAG